MTVTFRRPSRVSGVESMTGIDNVTPWHILHHHLEIVMMYDGHAEARAVRQSISSRSRYMEVAPNTMNVLLPGDFHETVRQRAPGTFQVLLFEPERVGELLPEVSRFEQLNFKPAVLSAAPRFRSLCRRVHALIDEDAEPLALDEGAARLLRSAVTVAGAAELRARFSYERQPDPARVRRVIDYLEAHCAESPRLGELAKLVDYDQFRLVRAFRVATGLTPHQYLLQIRIGRARARLKRGAPISAVALDSGFYDQSHLNRTFKAIVGVTPREYASGMARAKR
jgi:AraC-like DNA-binding protein